MKVPVYDAPQAEARADVPAAINLVQPDNSGLLRGIEAGADALGKGIDKAEEEYAKAKHEAQNVDAANGFAAYVNKATDKFHGTPQQPDQVDAGAGPDAKVVTVPVPPGEMASALPPAQQVDAGFLGTRGKEAAAAEQPLFKDLQQTRDQIAAGFADPETKKRFLARVQQYDIELREKAARHVEQQAEVARQDAQQNMDDAAVRSAAADPANDVLAAHLFGEAAGTNRGLFHGRPDAEEKHERALRADIASARLDNLLAPGPQQNIAKAREVLDANRGVLGKQLDNYERLVGSAERVAGAAPLAATLVRDAIRPDGSLDERKLYDGLSKVATTHPELFKDVQNFTTEQAAAARRAYDGETNKLLSRAVASYNVNGWQGMSVDLKQALNSRRDDPRGPELYKQLEHAGETELDRLERLQRIRANNKSAIREQNTIDTITKNEWEQELLKDPKAADLDLFLATHRGVSDKMKSELPNMQQKLINLQNKGLLSSRSEFVRQAVDAATGFIAAKAGSRKDKDAATLERNDFEAFAGRAFDTFVHDKEKEPMPKDVAGLTNAVIREYMGASGPLVPHTADAGRRAGAAFANDINAKSGTRTVTGTGVFKTDKNGVRWEKMSDGSARQVK